MHALLCASALAQTSPWSVRSPMPTARNALAGDAVNGLIYVIGGTSSIDRVDEVDPATGTWTQKSDMPTGRALLLSAIVKNNIYAIGGAVLLDDKVEVEVYDPLLDQPGLPPAFWTTYGLGCSGTPGVPEIGADSDPFLGNPQFTIELAGARPQSAGLLYLSLGAAGAPAGPCAVLLDLSLIAPGVPLDGHGRTAPVKIVLPRGLTFFAVGLGLDLETGSVSSITDRIEIRAE